MPVVYSVGLNPVGNTVTMTTISGVANSTNTFTSLNSHSNSTSTAVVRQEGTNTTTTKYIQLQPVRPGLTTGTMQVTSQTSTGVPVQRMVNSTSSPTTVQRPVNVPPGMVLTKTTTGQLVLVNGTQASNSTIQQSQGSTQTIVASTTRIVTTTAVTTPLSVTTVGRPVSVVSSVATLGKPAETKPAPATTTPITLSQEDLVDVHKCRNFLTTLIKLASGGGQPQETVQNVKALVQNLIDDKISPEDFTKRLQAELKSSPQPYLVPFLQRSLPLLRLTMLQQNQSGQANPAAVRVAQAAVRASTDSPKAPASPGIQAKMTAKTSKSNVKTFRNNVPEIRLPRVTSTGPPLKHPSLQTPPPEQPQAPFQQPSHPISIGGVRPSGPSNVRQTYSITPQRGQRWNTGGGGGGSSYKDDDDINDVASMAGVNLSEESARILATNSELVGTQTRSCSDMQVLNASVLQRRMSEIASRNPQIQHIHADAVKFLSCAAEARLKNIIGKLSAVVCHRMVNYKEEDHYKAISDVKTQLKFLQELDQIEKKKHDEAERDILMRAMKSRSKNDNPEHLRLKERAKEMQQQELEKMQIRNADETARNAIGPRKKKSRLDSPHSSAGLENHGGSASRSVTRSRTKRVNLRDLMFVMEHERETCKSTPLYKSYLK